MWDRCTNNYARGVDGTRLTRQTKEDPETKYDMSCKTVPSLSLPENTSTSRVCTVYFTIGSPTIVYWYFCF